MGLPRLPAPGLLLLAATLVVVTAQEPVADRRIAQNANGELKCRPGAPGPSHVWWDAGTGTLENVASHKLQ